MNRNDALDKLHSNSKSVCDETVRILVKIADNVIQNPRNPKVRSLQKSNATVSNKVLQIKGGLECLKLMGFQENETSLILPMNCPLDKVQEVKATLLGLDSKKATTTGGAVKKPVPKVETEEQLLDDNFELDKLPVVRFNQPPYASMFTNQFLKQVESYFHRSLAFDDKIAQDRAKVLIPIRELEIRAQENLRRVQREVKTKKMEDPEISLDDLTAVELMHWFKEDFFTWVDTLDCEHCGGQTKTSHTKVDAKDFPYTNRVEAHKCNTCNKFTYFPRYNDLNILLETRRGRCGEWAQVFTLCCRAMGWDARFVVDELDHVWTEVYSSTQKRWIHFDPCEDICDSPLLYEIGWNKKHSYIMAYSPDEVQDVTWRYSSNHKAVLPRRRLCSELDLVDALGKLRNLRQSKYSNPKKAYLTKRLLLELAELLSEKKPQDGDKQGRVSGSLDWRKGRGETRNEISHAWIIHGHHIVNGTLTVRYSNSKDVYEYAMGNGQVAKAKTWDAGVFAYENVFRKEENDWKMVYLCRSEGAEFGTISWKFQIADGTKKMIQSLALRFDRELYENGSVALTVKCDDDEAIVAPQDEGFELPTNCKSVVITAKLSGGKGDVAWQHAQLFRQPLSSAEFPFSLKFTFKDA